MNKETMQQCLDALKNNPQLRTVDLTGGAPEMNPDFRWFVEEIKKLDRHIIVRCNLTIILANKKYHDYHNSISNMVLKLFHLFHLHARRHRQATGAMGCLNIASKHYKC